MGFRHISGIDSRGTVIGRVMYELEPSAVKGGLLKSRDIHSVSTSGYGVEYSRIHRGFSVSKNGTKYSIIRSTVDLGYIYKRAYRRINPVVIAVMFLFFRIRVCICIR